MRADDHAFVALDAERGIPDRELEGEIAFFPFAGAGRPDTVGREGAHRQLVAAAGQEGSGDDPHKLRGLDRDRERPRARRGGGRGDNDLVDACHGFVHGVPVPLDELGTLAGVAFLDRVLDFRDCLVKRQNVAQREIGHLHDRVDAGAHAGFLGDPVGVDHVEFQLLRDDELLGLVREVIPRGVRAVRRVQKKDRPLPCGFEDRLLLEQVVLVAPDKIRRGDQIRCVDRLFSEPQMRDRDRAGLLGIVNKIRLRVEPELLGDDLDCVFVRADRAVGAEPEEDRLAERLARQVERRIVAEREPADIVFNPDRELLAGRLRLHVSIDRHRHGRREFLRGETEAARVDFGKIFPARVAFGAHGRGHIQEERLAGCARLFGPVQDGDLLHRGRQGIQERPGVERAVEADLENPRPLAGAVEVPGGFQQRFGAGPHHHHHAVRFRVAGVVEQVIRAAGQRGKTEHRLLHDPGQGRVERVRRLAGLEKGVRVLGGSADARVIRRHRAFRVGLDRALVEHGAERVVGEQFQIVDLV